MPPAIVPGPAPCSLAGSLQPQVKAAGRARPTQAGEKALVSRTLLPETSAAGKQTEAGRSGPDAGLGEEAHRRQPCRSEASPAD